MHNGDGGAPPLRPEQYLVAQLNYSCWTTICCYVQDTNSLVYLASLHSTLREIVDTDRVWFNRRPAVKNNQQLVKLPTTLNSFLKVPVDKVYARLFQSLKVRLRDAQRRGTAPLTCFTNDFFVEAVAMRMISNPLIAEVFPPAQSLMTPRFLLRVVVNHVTSSNSSDKQLLEDGEEEEFVDPEIVHVRCFKLVRWPYSYPPTPIYLNNALVQHQLRVSNNWLQTMFPELPQQQSRRRRKQGQEEEEQQCVVSFDPQTGHVATQPEDFLLDCKLIPLLRQEAEDDICRAMLVREALSTASWMAVKLAGAAAFFAVAHTVATWMCNNFEASEGGASAAAGFGALLHHFGNVTRHHMQNFPRGVSVPTIHPYLKAALSMVPVLFWSGEIVYNFLCVLPNNPLCLLTNYSERTWKFRMLLQLPLDFFCTAAQILTLNALARASCLFLGLPVALLVKPAWRYLTYAAFVVSRGYFGDDTSSMQLTDIFMSMTVRDVEFLAICSIALPALIMGTNYTDLLHTPTTYFGSPHPIPLKLRYQQPGAGAKPGEWVSWCGDLMMLFLMMTLQRTADDALVAKDATLFSCFKAVAIAAAKSVAANAIRYFINACGRWWRVRRSRMNNDNDDEEGDKEKED